MSSKKYSNFAPAISAISTLEMRRILISLAESSDPVNLRFRLLGEMWQPNFMQIVTVCNNSVVFKDEVNSKVVVLSDLRRIMQFELDGSLFGLEPNFHYDVAPS